MLPPPPKGGLNFSHPPQHQSGRPLPRRPPRAPPAPPHRSALQPHLPPSASPPPTPKRGSSLCGAAPRAVWTCTELSGRGVGGAFRDRFCSLQTTEEEGAALRPAPGRTCPRPPLQTSPRSSLRRTPIGRSARGAGRAQRAAGAQAWRDVAPCPRASLTAARVRLGGILSRVHAPP